MIDINFISRKTILEQLEALRLVWLIFPDHSHSSFIPGPIFIKLLDGHREAPYTSSTFLYPASPLSILARCYIPPLKC